MHIIQMLGCKTYCTLRMLMLVAIVLVTTGVFQESYAQSLHNLLRNYGSPEVPIHRKVLFDLKTSIYFELSEGVRQRAASIPELKKLPVLEKFYGNQEFLNSETEFVVIITSLFVKAANKNKLAKPDDRFAPVSEKANYLLGRLNRA